QLLLRRDGNIVLRQQLADGSTLPLGARSVVAKDVEHECVVSGTEPVELVENATDLHIDVLEETREHFHEAPLERSLGLRYVIPRLHRVGAPSQCGIYRDPALRPLPGKHTLAILVPTIIEPASVLVGPFLEYVVWTVRGAGCPVHEERLVRCEGLMLAK